MFLFALVYTAGTVFGMYGRGFGFLLFAILLVILIAECVASKGSFFGVRRIVVLLILISSAVFATAQFRYTLVQTVLRQAPVNMHGITTDLKNFVIRCQLHFLR